MFYISLLPLSLRFASFLVIVGASLEGRGLSLEALGVRIISMSSDSVSDGCGGDDVDDEGEVIVLSR